MNVNQDQWQPIATAPKDGTHILACHAGKPFDDTWSFNQAPPAVVHWWGFPEDAAGFYLSSSVGEQMKPYEYTHWKRLVGTEPCDTKRLEAEAARYPSPAPTLICSRCGVDRFKVGCPEANCAMVFSTEASPQPKFYTGQQD